MGNSLRDELLRVGLTDENEQKNQKSEKYRQAKRSAKRKKSQRAAPQDAPSPSPVLREKVARDRALNRGLEAQRNRKAVQAQVREIIKRHQLNDSNGEISHNFVQGKHIKRVYVTAEQHQQLTAGLLAIAVFQGHCYVIPAETAVKVLGLDSDTFISLVTEESASEADDPYADRPVPDDLMW